MTLKLCLKENAVYSSLPSVLFLSSFFSPEDALSFSPFNSALFFFLLTATVITAAAAITATAMITKSTVLCLLVYQNEILLQ